MRIARGPDENGLVAGTCLSDRGDCLSEIVAEVLLAVTVD